MTNNLHIEQYTQEHKGACTELFFKVYSAPPFDFDWLDSDKASGYLTDLENTPNSLSFVLKENDTVIGVCLGQKEQHFLSSGYKINELFIEPDHQHQGLGSQFLDEVENKLRELNIDTINLLTQRHMDSFIFYQKHDFIPSEETVHMTKVIRPESPVIYARTFVSAED